MKFSILTATYNRAELLKRLYNSLLENLSEQYEIEWLIMDDGSKDNTQDVCKFFVNKDGLSVKYFSQENAGKMCAINNLIDKVSGDYIIECDSDDYFIKNALKIVAEKCKILHDNKELYAAVFLRNEEAGKLSGKQFPFTNQDTTMFDLYFKHNWYGESVVVYDANIRKQYKYIIEPGERFCTEARLHHIIEQRYKVRCYNDIILEGEYQENGYTQNLRKIFLNNPKGHYMYFKEILEKDMKGVTFSKRIYAIKHYILFKYLSNTKNGLKGVKGFLNRILYVVLYIPGIIKSKSYKNKGA